MSKTFKPGDRVRRTAPSALDEMVMGKEYTVQQQTSGVDLRLVGVTFSYDPGCFELATPEFQVGDRVRATASNGSDIAEFTIRHLDRDGCMTSERNYFDVDEWDFELLSRPEPPKPLPTEPGLYTTGPGWYDGFCALLLSRDGTWSWVDPSFQGSVRKTDRDIVQGYADRLARIY